MHDAPRHQPARRTPPATGAAMSKGTASPARRRTGSGRRRFGGCRIARPADRRSGRLPRQRDAAQPDDRLGRRLPVGRGACGVRRRGADAACACCRAGSRSTGRRRAPASAVAGSPRAAPRSSIASSSADHGRTDRRGARRSALRRAATASSERVVLPRAAAASTDPSVEGRHLPQRLTNLRQGAEVAFSAAAVAARVPSRASASADRVPRSAV
jgi:hypothetical protein